MDRRRFLQATASLPLAVSPVIAQARGHVVVVGGGFGGATAAKYLRTYAPALKVTLVEPGDVFYSCPLSCRVLIGAMGIRELSQSYEKPAEVMRWYLGDRQRMAEVEAVVIETNVTDFVLARANEYEADRAAADARRAAGAAVRLVAVRANHHRQRACNPRFATE